MKTVLAAFAFEGKVTDLRECTAGHINGTYRVTTDKHRYILQKINKSVFKKPWEVMENIVGVSEHIRKKLADEGKDPLRGALSFVKAGDAYYYQDERGDFWRAYHYVDGDCFQSCESPDLFRRVGRAFGVFQRQLADYDASTLHEVIPDFHNTEKRYEAFEQAVLDDVCGRAAACKKEIDFLRERKNDCGVLVRGLREGKYPLRVTHNDTKLNNVIMDPTTGEGLCVIDLDTVMPGSLLYDFGDAIRFGASSAGEDETDLSKVHIVPELFATFAEGFSSGLGGHITEAERRALPESARILTLETGMRFLTDYLSGDTYFRIHHEGHNLERAKNQFRLVESIEEKMPILDRIVGN